jgi:hypothetical protein
MIFIIGFAWKLLLSAELLSFFGHMSDCQLCHVTLSSSSSEV